MLPDLSPEPTATGPPVLHFADGGKRERLRLRSGTAAVVNVAVREPGQVQLAGLGLSSAAEPLTPASFDVLGGEPGRHDVRFSPANGRPEVIGVLTVTRATTTR